MSEWISVKERLPEMDGKWYLVNMAGYLDEDRNIMDTYCAQGQGAWNGYIGRGLALPVGAGITHWMPLPAPPEEEA